MNAGQIVRNVLRTFRQDGVEDSSRMQYLYDVLNNAISNILSYQTDWSFLYRYGHTILSVADDNEYALPTDCERVLNVTYDSTTTKLELFRPKERYRYATSSGNVAAATVMDITTSPYANVGFVFPTMGDAVVKGSGTAFDQNMVGRFFKARADGAIYKIKSFDSTTQITLRQKFGGATQAGKISIYGTGDELKSVYGQVGITNFRNWMVNSLIRIDSVDYQIATVDEEIQKLTLTAQAVAGEQQTFSVQDQYQIDPPGVKKLILFDTPGDDDKNIVVDYYASQTPIMNEFDVPILPAKWHNLAQYGTVLEYGATEDSDSVNINRIQGLYDRGIANLLNSDDPLDSEVDDVNNYDKFRELP